MIKTDPPTSTNTVYGTSAGVSLSATSEQNTLIGYQAGQATTSSANLMLGYRAGYSNTSGTFNSFIGVQAGYFNTTGSNNVFSGHQAGFANSTGSRNTIMGHEAGLANNADANTFIGYHAGRATTSGLANVFVGSQAGLNNTAGIGNMFLGQQAGASNTTGNYNLFVGNSSGSATTNGLGNTAIGDGSLLRNVTGTRSTAIGQYAGVESRSDENVFIGFAADVTPATPNLTNATAIGARARVSQSNSIVLGNGASVGIGTSAPLAKLHLTSGITNTSGLRLENLTSGSPATALNQTKFLTVNASGDVVLGSSNGSARIGAENWTVAGESLQNTNAGSVIIGQEIEKTPAGYKLVGEEGILTEKVKVAVKNTADWSDKVFAPGYRLTPLSEVEQYIKTHQHLPGILSAEQVVKEGIDVAKMNAKLLEKIEELTLYVLTLNKEVTQLRQQQSQQRAYSVSRKSTR